MVRILPFFIVVLFTVTAAAQQVASYTQYMFNGLAINPAYAGSHEALSTSFLSRFQNVGLRGSPNTQTLSIHSPLLNKRVALGMLVIHDQISVIDQTGIHFMYAYRLPVFGGKGTLSMGLQGGVSFYRADYTHLDIYNPNDPVFGNDVREARPNFGAGLFYYTKFAYAGVSMPNLINNVFDRGAQFQTVYQNKPIILTGGYVFTLNRMLKIKPNALLKFLDDRPVEFDLNCNLLLDEVLWVGLSYKSSNAIALLTQIQITDQLQFGYSYQVATGPINSVAVGSHELMVNYRFMYHKKGLVSPRYF
ncbi:MAG TPA: type IX secretion system membrane protein PorP/SprF [Cyclobacteriaceae bacterium]|jgi:type IX secretion system PorP/SprF family membrane protein|nr:type IX secretion system membrane protein PorP/SprF [Cyclobacteriaceae bacterium]